MPTQRKILLLPAKANFICNTDKENNDRLLVKRGKPYEIHCKSQQKRLSEYFQRSNGSRNNEFRFKLAKLLKINPEGRNLC